ncbi:MAG: molybdopterin-binding protein, partial [Chloroflexota bacterium]|nr:molybdopterin-binding protein [Chloroflexota bacterium]
MKKGTRLTKQDILTLQSIGHTKVDVAILSDDDVHEDEAAEIIAAALLDGSALLRATRGVGGRVNVHVEEDGVLYVDAPRLVALNQLTGITLATRHPYTPLGPSFDSTQAATLKIIPYAIPRAIVDEAVQLTQGVMWVIPLAPRRVALLITAHEGSQPRIRQQFETPTQERLSRLGSMLATVDCVPEDEMAIAEAAQRLLTTHDALIIGGQTSVMDIEDITPRALAQIGAEVTLHGAPVEPGNLLALAYHDNHWIMCAPGCAKSPSLNIVDLLLPRLIAGEKVGRREIAELGLG